MSGQNRINIHPGLAVAIIIRKDQRTDRIMQGTVKDILITAPFHSRGITCRLEDGRSAELMPSCDKLLKGGTPWLQKRSSSSKEARD